MNKARKKKYKRGLARHLVHESFVLSLTRRLSTRFVRFFEFGFASILLKSYRVTDDFVRQKITGRVFNKLSLRENFIQPARNAAASFFAENTVMKWFSVLRTRFLNTSVRSVGIFSLFFGIYAAALFLLKSYVSLSFGTAADINDISTAAVCALIGILFILFGDKTLISTLGGGRIIGSLLSRCLGANDSSLERYKNANAVNDVAVAFLLGSLCGILTMFFAPAKVLIGLLAVLVAIAIMNIPEFGLLIAVSGVSFMPIWLLTAVCLLTFASHLFKCLRLKRNLSFGTADVVMLLACFSMLIVFAGWGGGMTEGEKYLFCFTLLYFAAKNLLVSETLVIQSFNALCFGTSIGMALYILGDFATLIPHEELRSAALLLTRHTLAPEMLAVLVVSVLPFALASFSHVDGRRPRKSFLILTLASLIITDSAFFYLLVFVSLFVYIAFAYKAPAGALLGALVTIPTVSFYTFEHTLSHVVRFGERLSYDSVLSVSENAVGANLWTAAMEVGLGFAVLLFFAAMLLIFQRLLGTGIGEAGTRRTLFIGTAASSATMLLVCSFIFNSLYDIRIYAVMCFIFGLCGGLYKTISVVKRSEEV
ncbi:MAG: hypothetical protein IKZ05_05140 [Clostridia bacterium]|nr:hypothetical protein [Clostridia bacterium]